MLLYYDFLGHDLMVVTLLFCCVSPHGLARQAC